MDFKLIFGLQILLSVVLVAMVTRWIVAPWLAGKPQSERLFWLTLPHATRHIGLVFLVPGIVSTSLPEGFAAMAGYGDFAAGVLAMIALVALRNQWPGAIGLTALFHIVGFVDLANALRHAEAIQHLGAAWFIPTFWVPVLLVSHVMVFSCLIRSVARWGNGYPPKYVSTTSSSHQDTSRCRRIRGKRRRFPSGCS